jgi:hypothetical protein
MMSDKNLEEKVYSFCKRDRSRSLCVMLMMTVMITVTSTNYETAIYLVSEIL